MKGPAWNKHLAKILKDPEIGIDRDIRSPFWPVNDGLERIHFGFADPIAQRDYILAHPEQGFTLHVRGAEEYWRKNYESFVGIPNIEGIGGSNLPLSTFLLWPDLTYVFMGDGCDDFSAEHFPKLKSLRGGFAAARDRGIAGHQNLESIYAVYAPRGRINLGDLGGLPRLRNVGVTYGQFCDLTFLQRAERVEVLSLRGATQIRSFEGVERLQNLRFLWLEDARRLEDISALFDLPKLEKAYFNSCRKVERQDEFARHLTERGGLASL